MAVRPTDDRSVDITTPAAPSRLYVVSAALAVVVVVCAGLLVYFYVHNTDGDGSVGQRVSTLFGDDTTDTALVKDTLKDALRDPTPAGRAALADQVIACAVALGGTPEATVTPATSTQVIG